MKRFNFAPNCVMESLQSRLAKDGLIDLANCVSRPGSSQTEPFLVGRIELGLGFLYVLLDRTMGDYPANLIYGYMGAAYLFQENMRSGLRGFVPTLAEPCSREGSDNNWNVELIDKGSGGISLVLPMRIVYIAAGAHELLAWVRP